MVFLILLAGIKMLIKMKKTSQNIVLFVFTFGVMIAFSLCSIAFSSIYYILIGGAVGLIIYLINWGFHYKKESNRFNDENTEDKEQ